MQGRGLRTILLAAIYLLADKLEIRELRGEVLAENPVMPQWLPRLGATLEATSEPAYRLIRWSVREAGDKMVEGNVTHFELWLERLRSTFSG